MSVQSSFDTYYYHTAMPPIGMVGWKMPTMRSSLTSMQAIKQGRMLPPGRLCKPEQNFLLQV